MVAIAKPVVTALLLAVVLSAKCGGAAAISLASLRASLNAAPALVNSLVATGAIPSSAANLDIADFGNASGIGMNLANELKAAGTDSERAAAAHRAVEAWQRLMQARLAAERPTPVHPRVSQIFATVQGILLFIEAFYADRAGEISRAGAPAVDGLSDDDFMDALETRLKELEEQVKAPVR